MLHLGSFPGFASVFPLTPLLNTTFESSFPIFGFFLFESCLTTFTCFLLIFWPIIVLSNIPGTNIDLILVLHNFCNRDIRLIFSTSALSQEAATPWFPVITVPLGFWAFSDEAATFVGPSSFSLGRGLELSPTLTDGTCYSSISWHLSALWP